MPPFTKPAVPNSCLKKSRSASRPRRGAHPHTAVGLTSSTSKPSGLYPLPLASGLGGEAGVVEEVGAGVTIYKPGDASPMAQPRSGSYAEARLIRRSPAETARWYRRQPPRR